MAILGLKVREILRRIKTNNLLRTGNDESVRQLLGQIKLKYLRFKVTGLHRIVNRPKGISAMGRRGRVSGSKQQSLTSYIPYFAMSLSKYNM